MPASGKIPFHLRAFLRCQAYDKKVRWTFFSYIAGNVKLSIFDIILTQFDEKSLFFNYQSYYL